MRTKRGVFPESQGAPVGRGPASDRERVSRRRRIARLLVFPLALFLSSLPLNADYVGSLVNRIFLDPASIPVVTDGYDNGDVVSFILETTPADTGSDNGHAAWMSVYIPPGAEVVGAEFVLPATNGGYDAIPAEDTDDTYDGWGVRGAEGYSPTTGATQLGEGYVNEVQQDTGIFYSTDPRTQLVVDGVDDDCDGTPDLVSPTGVANQLVYNRFDFDQTRAFGEGFVNGGNGNTPIRGTGCTGDDGVGCTWTGVGSIVAGPDTYYTNDYDPGHDDCSDGPGGSFNAGCDLDGIPDDFLAESACVGPFQRIVYPNSKLGGSDSPEKCAPGATCPPFATDPTVILPAYEQGEIRFTALPTSVGWDFTGDGALPSGNLALSSNPSPETTYMIRFVHGKRRLGELENARVTLRIIDSSLFNQSVFIDDGASEATDDETFCLDSTGGDTSDTAGKDNPFRYYEPQHECAFLGGKGTLLKEAKFVNGEPSNGASLSVGDIISYQVSFTNTSGGDLTLIDLYDRAEDFQGNPTGNLDLLEPGDPLCAWSDYDGDLPGPAYQAGTATAGQAQWDQIAVLGAGQQVQVFLCAEVTGGGVNDRLDNTAFVDYNFSPSPADRVTLKSTAGGTISTLISGAVYNDVDGSGDLTAGDAGVGGVVVELYQDLDGDGVVDPGEPLVDSRTTLTDGSYSFAGIPGGDYVVVETDPAGWTSTGDADNALGSCASGNGCNAIGVTVAAGGASTLNDFFDQAPTADTNVITGTTYLDLDSDGVFEPVDGESGSGGITVRLYRDNNNDGTVDLGDTLLQTQVTDGAGEYEFVITEEGSFVLEIDETTLPIGASLTTDNVEEADFVGFGNTDAGNDFGFFGGVGSEGGVCYAVADSVDQLTAFDISPPTFFDIGPTGTTTVEAMARDPFSGILYAANGGRLGTLNAGTGAFTAVPGAPASQTCSLPGGATVTVDDLDGLTFDPYTGLLYATERDGDGTTPEDVLLRLDPATGLVVPDAFGAGVSCVRIPTNTPATNNRVDVDDIAIDPTDGQMYGIANSGGVLDRLVRIDKATGAVTDVAQIGVGDIEGLGFANDGTLYATNGNAAPNGRLYTLNKSTAAATLVFNFPSYGDYESVDCMTAAPNVVTGTVFYDPDTDGLLDPGEVGYQGATVRFYLDDGDGIFDPLLDTLLETTTSDADGFYSFETAGAGTFWVDTDFPDSYPAGATLTTDNEERADFVAGGNQVDTGNDFGLILPAGTLTLDKSSSAEGFTVAQGGTITYSLEPRVPGSDLLTGVQVSDLIPAGTTFIGGTASPTQSSGPDPLVWDLGDHAPGVPGVVETALCPGTFTAEPVADTYVQEDQADSAHGTENDVKTRPEATKQKHSLLRWDLASIPAGAVVDEARMTLRSNNTRNNHVVEIRRMLTAWTEAGATWNDAIPGTSDWATPDGPGENPAEVDGFLFGVNDYDTTVATPPTMLPVGGNIFVTAEVTDIVEAWLAGTNRGLVMLATGTDNGDANWDSREEGDATRRPVLEVFYRVPTLGGCSSVDSLVASADTFVQQDTADTNRGADGDLKTRPEVTKRKHVLIDFDLVGIPPGATINSATFTIEVTGARSNHTVNVRRMITPWTESGATWNDAIPGTSDWATPDGPGENPAETDGFLFGASDYAETYGTINIATTGSRSLNVTALVDAWINGGAPQNGVVLLATGTDNGDSKFNSRDKAPPPTLVVDWTLPPDETTTEITVAGSLASDGDMVTVTMTLDSARDDTNVAPGPLTVNPFNGASAVCGAPSPASQNLTAGTPITFEWTCTVSATAGELLGRLTFEADAAGDNLTFANGLSHTVMVAPPLTFSVLVDDPIDPNQHTIVNTATATSDQTPPATDLTVDAVGKGVIGDRVWLDSDGDGIQDVGEEGIANVEVTLYSAGGDGMPGGGDDVALATAITGADGKYLFTDLPPGTYFVDVTDATVPDGLTTAPGTTDPSTVRTITKNEVYLDLDFGYVPDAGTSVIGDYVWSDADGDGVQDPGEPGIGGVTVTLRSAGPDGILGTPDDVIEDTAVTTPDGKYLFDGVAEGEYVVVVDETSPALAGYTVTSGPQSQGDETSEPITVLADDVFVDADFGYFQAGLGSIGSQVWLDEDGDGFFDAGTETGISGVTVDLIQDTNGDGIWDPDGADDTFGTPDDEPVIATALTGADGSYSFDGLRLDDGGGDGDADYLVSVSDDAGRVAAMTQTFGLVGVDANGQTDPYAVALSAGSPSNDTADFAFEPSNAIGDQIWSDADGDGIQDPEEIGLGGVLLNLLDDLGNPVLDGLGNPITATTAPDGSYLFPGVDPGDYLVEVDASNFAPGGALEGYLQTGDPDEGGSCVTCDGQGSSTILLGSSDLTQDFGFQADTAPVYPVSGTVFEDPDADGLQEAGEPGIGGVTVELLDAAGNVLATATTDVNGDYTFPDLPDGDYSVRVTDTAGVLEGYTLTSGLDERAVTVAGAPVTDVDFGYVRKAGTAALGDRVWYDANRNGIQEAGEGGISGVTLDLYGVGPDGLAGTGDDVYLATTTTDANGEYLFAGLPAGSYYVDVTDTAGKLTGLAPTPGTVDPSAAYALSEGEQNRDADFGYAPATDSALGDTIWYDADGDGFQDPGEVGIAGVTVTLTDPGPDGSLGGGDDVVVGSAVTDAQGNYLFLDLGPGSANCTQASATECKYFVSVDTGTLPAGYDTTPTNGPALRPFGVYVGQDTLNADFGFNGGVTGSIGDTVYLDVDGDSTQDAGEPGIANVTLDLVDSVTGEVLATTTTDSDGGYLFVGLPAGDYEVVVTDLNNVLPLLNPSQSPTLPITITGAGEDVDTADFGFVPSGGVGSIGNQIWRDKDADGLFEPLGDDGIAGTSDDETGFENVTVQLWLDDGDGIYEPFSGDDNLVRTTLTEADGKYQFLALPEGTYFVTVSDEFGVLTGFTKTVGPTPGADNNSQAQPGYQVDITVADPVNQTADFGYEAAADLQLSGTAFFDVNGDGILDSPTESGVEKVELFLFRDLDGDGVLDPGEPQIDAVTVSDGTIDVDGDGMIDPVGFYAFIDLPSGDYIITADPSASFVDGMNQTTQTEPGVPQGGIQPVSLSGIDSTDNDFGFTITSTVVLVSAFDARADGSGVTVRWETTSQSGTVGFYLYRLDSESGEWSAVNEELLPASLLAPSGAIYELYDAEAAGGRSKLVYSLVEVEAAGGERTYGPFEPRLGDRPVVGEPVAKSGRVTERRPSQRMDRRMAARKAERGALAMAKAAAAAPSGLRGRRPPRAEGRLKIEVAAEGLVRVSDQAIAEALGISRGAAHGALQSGRLALSHGGEAVSWTEMGNDLLFFAERFEHPHTPMDVYWLDLGDGVEMDVAAAGPGGGATVFDEERRFESDLFSVTIVPDSPVEDFYYWAFVTAGSPASGTAAVSFDVDEPTGAGTARLGLELQGVTSTPASVDHRVVARLNGVEIGATTWDGAAPHQATFEFPAELLLAGANQLELEGRLEEGLPYSTFLLDSVEIAYQRRLRAVGDRLLFTSAASGPVSVSGFSGPGTLLFDVSSAQRPVRIEGLLESLGDGWTIGFETVAGGRYLAVAPGAVAEANALSARPISKLLKDRGGIDYVVVAPADLVPAAQRLVDYRRGFGLSGAVFELEEIQDVFAHGLATPEAIRDFFRFASESWGAPPSYGVLAGAGNFDYKNVQGLDSNLVPTLMTATPYGLFASDSLFGDVTGDGIPEIAIGRIPALTAEELGTYVDKLAASEKPGSPASLLLIADDADGAGDFPRFSDALLERLPAEVASERVYLSEHSVSEARQRIFDAVAAGVRVVNYQGHGGLGRLADEGVLLSADAESLAGPQLPLFATLTCSVGRFEVPGFESLAEALVMAPEGGAAAVFAPTGQSLSFEADEMNRVWIDALYSGEHLTVGEAMLATLGYDQVGSFPFMRSIFNLLGDPAYGID